MEKEFIVVLIDGESIGKASAAELEFVPELGGAVLSISMADSVEIPHQEEEETLRVEKVSSEEEEEDLTPEEDEDLTEEDLDLLIEEELSKAKSRPSARGIAVEPEEERAEVEEYDISPADLRFLQERSELREHPLFYTSYSEPKEFESKEFSSPAEAYPDLPADDEESEKPGPFSEETHPYTDIELESKEFDIRTAQSEASLVSLATVESTILGKYFDAVGFEELHMPKLIFSNNKETPDLAMIKITIRVWNPPKEASDD